MLVWYYKVMAKFTFELDDSLDEKFRKTVVLSKGLRRGVIQQSIQASKK